MPLLLLLPLLLAAVFALWVLLLPLAIVQRYRHGRARRRVQPWFVGANAWLLALSALVFLASAWGLGHWVPGALPDAALGLGAGLLAGLAGLRLDRFEATPQGFFRTPNRWLVLGLSLLLAARIAVGAWLAWQELAGSAGLAWVTRGGLLAVAGVLLGYASATAWGLRARVRRRQGLR